MQSGLVHKSIMVKERYWSVRIGDPRRHHPYLMLDVETNKRPVLFDSEIDAETAAMALSKDTPCRVVRVEIKELRRH